MQEKGVLPVTSSLGVLGCWASHTGSGSRSATGKDPCWLVGRGQGREVRPISRNLELCPALVKLQERRETAGINAGSWVCTVHALHARISWSWYVVGYFDHTGARAGYRGHAMEKMAGYGGQT